MARRNGDNLLKLVNQLLDFQKSEEHDYKPHLQPIDLHALLSTQTAKFALLARQKGITSPSTGVRTARWCGWMPTW
jgi:signal transduction histidine kinase